MFNYRLVKQIFAIIIFTLITSSASDRYSDLSVCFSDSTITDSLSSLPKSDSLKDNIFYRDMNAIFKIRGQTEYHSNNLNTTADGSEFTVNLGLLRDLVFTYREWEFAAFSIGLFLMNDKYSNSISNTTNRSKHSVRLTYPNSYPLKSNSLIDIELYYLQPITSSNSNIYNLTSLLLNRDEETLSNINYSEGIGFAVSFSPFLNNILINIHYNYSDSSKDLLKQTSKINPVNGKAFYSFEDISLTMSTYLRLYSTSKLKLEMGFIGYNITSYQTIDNSLKVENHSELGVPILGKKILPTILYFGFEYLVQRDSHDYVFGLSSSYFDGHIKSNLWFRVFKIPSIKTEMRFIFNSITKRITSQQKIWEEGEKPAFDVNLAIRYGF